MSPLARQLRIGLNVKRAIRREWESCSEREAVPFDFGRCQSGVNWRDPRGAFLGEKGVKGG